MIREASQPCPLCGRKPKLHSMDTPERGKEWSASCIGPKHAVSVHRQDTPDSAVEEWDKRLKAWGAAMDTVQRAIDEDAVKDAG